MAYWDRLVPSTGQCGARTPRAVVTSINTCPRGRSLAPKQGRKCRRDAVLSRLPHSAWKHQTRDRIMRRLGKCGVLLRCSHIQTFAVLRCAVGGVSVPAAAGNGFLRRHRKRTSMGLVACDRRSKASTKSSHGETEDRRAPWRRTPNRRGPIFRDRRSSVHMGAVVMVVCGVQREPSADGSGVHCSQVE
jgi:hypothetical protein